MKSTKDYIGEIAEVQRNRKPNSSSVRKAKSDMRMLMVSLTDSISDSIDTTYKDREDFIVERLGELHAMAEAIRDGTHNGVNTINVDDSESTDRALYTLAKSIIDNIRVLDRIHSKMFVSIYNSRVGKDMLPDEHILPLSKEAERLSSDIRKAAEEFEIKTNKE